jgi:hypothetical protein
VAIALGLGAVHLRRVAAHPLGAVDGPPARVGELERVAGVDEIEQRGQRRVAGEIVLGARERGADLPVELRRRREAEAVIALALRRDAGALGRDQRGGQARTALARAEP